MLMTHFVYTSRDYYGEAEAVGANVMCGVMVNFWKRLQRFWVVFLDYTFLLMFLFIT